MTNSADGHRATARTNRDTVTTISKIASDFGTNEGAVLALAARLGIEAWAPTSVVPEDEASRLREALRPNKATTRKPGSPGDTGNAAPPKPSPKLFGSPLLAPTPKTRRDGLDEGEARLLSWLASGVEKSQPRSRRRTPAQREGDRHATAARHQWPRLSHAEAARIGLQWAGAFFSANESAQWWAVGLEPDDAAPARGLANADVRPRELLGETDGGRSLIAELRRGASVQWITAAVAAARRKAAATAGALPPPRHGPPPRRSTPTWRPRRY
ncbi:hypothetical protein [Cryptosporangium arvum]|uniref:hypothetical protein n=1 Tax=Cryptosporangium arvum TaxID=80871 RepID=UPI0012EE4CE9|nr:hypothetical protein [Cryptosporangium arvum]